MNRTRFFKRPSNAMVRIFNFRAYFSLLTCIKATGEEGVGRWRGYSTNVYMLIRGGSAPRSNSLHFYKPFFYLKGTPFVYLLLTNGISFTDLIYNFASLLTAVTALTFK